MHIVVPDIVTSSGNYAARKFIFISFLYFHALERQMEITERTMKIHLSRAIGTS